MSTPPQVEEMDRDSVETQNGQPIRLWTALPITEQRQLARHWARLIQQIRHTSPEEDTEASTYGP
jgi:hypothetical protein